MSTRLVVAAIDPDSGLAALYLDSELIWDFGPHDPFHGPLGLPTFLDDALEALCEGLGDIHFGILHGHPISTKTWTDYGWEWDSEWPQKVGDVIPAVEPEP